MLRPEIRALSASQDAGAETPVREEEQVPANHGHGTPADCFTPIGAMTTAWVLCAKGGSVAETAAPATEGKCGGYLVRPLQLDRCVGAEARLCTALSGCVR